MGSRERPSSPTFPIPDPIIVDDEMENKYRDTDMEFLDPSKLEMSSDYVGDDVNSYIVGNQSPRTATSAEYPSGFPARQKSYPGNGTLKKPNVLNMSLTAPADSPADSGRSSSSDSPPGHLRRSSPASTTSATNGESNMLPFGYAEEWESVEPMAVRDNVLFGMDGTYPLDADIESSNKAMDAAFDFESAASNSPRPLKTDGTQQPKVHNKSANTQALNPPDHPRQFPERMVVSPVSRVYRLFSIACFNCTDLLNDSVLRPCRPLFTKTFPVFRLIRSRLLRGREIWPLASGAHSHHPQC